MSTDTATRVVEGVRVNPYAGPRSLRREDGIYGRSREIRELRASLLAHRIVLLYSQSGAGKTSLIEAGLRPEFEERGFQVFPTIRVGYEAPGDAEEANRYVFSTLASLEEGLAPEDQLDPAELAGISLDEYVRRRDEQIPDSDPLLVIDQFEELFTLDPTDWDQKREFIEEIGRTLEDRGRWALFAMREDFIAQLDPYLTLIPTQLSTRYRLELLNPSGAIEAVKQPASTMGVEFTDEAAAHLVNDLRRIQVQRGDRPVLELGPSVEPVQLQVVCHRVWAGLSEGETLIEPGDIAQAGTVNEALADFYETQVKIAADRTRGDEHAIRNWFETRLITPDGFRTQVRTGPSEDADLVLATLQSSHLIRSDRIRGAEWYELSHDRFVEPLRASNAEFMRRRRNHRLRIALVAAGVLVVAAILILLSTAFVGTTASAPTLGSDAEEIEFGDTTSGRVELPGEIDVYEFEAGQSETVLVTVVAADAELIPEVSLLDAQEARLTSTAGDPVPGEPEVLALTTPSAGRYLVAVTGSRGSSGAFELRVSRPAVDELTRDVPVTGSIARTEAVTVHRIEGIAAGDSLAVRLSPEDELSVAAFELFGPNGASLSTVEALGGGSAQAVLEAELDGTYLVAVQGSESSTGAYEIELLGAQTIGFGEVVSQEIEQSGDVTVLRFHAAAGDVALVTAIARDSLSPSIDLYDPSGRWISEAIGFLDELGEPWYLAAPTPAAGTYHVVVGGFDGSVGEFELTLERPEVEDLTLDQPSDGSVSATASVGVHRLSAAAGDSIVVRVAPASGFVSARFELFGPGGEFLTSGINFDRESGVITLEAPEDGSYLVTVGSRSGSTGSYVVERVDASSLGFAQVAEGSVDGDQEMTPFGFSAAAGENVLITVVAPDEGLNPVVELYDPQGNFVSSGVGFFDDPGEPWILAAPISTAGRHHVTVNGSSADEEGPFEISVRRPEASNLPLGATVQGSIDDPVMAGVHRLNASAGESIAVRTTPDSGLGTAAVSVFGPDGAFLTSGISYSDESGLPTIVEAPTDGSYLVAVTGIDRAVGGYEISRIGVRRLNVDQVVEEEGSGSGHSLVYSFDAAEGEIPLMTLIAPDDAQPEMNLYDPDGLWVSDGVGFQEPGEPWILPALIATRGLHHVTVSAEGPSQLSLTRPPTGTIALGEAITGTITDELPLGMHLVDAAVDETLVVRVTPEDAFETAAFEAFGPRGWFITSGIAPGGSPGDMTFETSEEGAYLITVHGYQGSIGTYELTVGEFATGWKLSSLVPDFLVASEPGDYIQNSGGTSTNCLDWDDTQLIEEDSIIVNPQFPLALDHYVWAWAGTFESGAGVASYLGSFGDGCVHPLDPSTRIYEPTELENGLLWYLTTQESGEAELLQSVGVLGSTDTGVAEVQLVLTDFDGFVREIEIDPEDPYGSPEARELAEEMIEPLQERLSAMASP